MPNRLYPQINDFSWMLARPISLGTEIVMPNWESQGKDSVDLIRDGLFSIQVQQPYYYCNLMIPI